MPRFLKNSTATERHFSSPEGVTWIADFYDQADESRLDKMGQTLDEALTQRQQQQPPPAGN
jgi:hypothetical protein